jgi:hypothetical protein
MTMIANAHAGICATFIGGKHTLVTLEHPKGGFTLTTTVAFSPDGTQIVQDKKNSLTWIVKAVIRKDVDTSTTPAKVRKLMLVLLPKNGITTGSSGLDCGDLSITLTDPTPGPDGIPTVDCIPVDYVDDTY